VKQKVRGMLMNVVVAAHFNAIIYKGPERECVLCTDRRFGAVNAEME